MDTNTDQPDERRALGPAEEIAGLALALAGAVTFVLGLVRHSRLKRALGLLLLIAGGGFFARLKLAERGEKIGAAEGRIRSELDDLDPVARAQVLADMAREQM
jgi:hypothetical protein